MAVQQHTRLETILSMKVSLDTVDYKAVAITALMGLLCRHLSAQYRLHFVEFESLPKHQTHLLKYASEFA